MDSQFSKRKYLKKAPKQKTEKPYSFQGKEDVFYASSEEIIESSSYIESITDLNSGKDETYIRFSDNLLTDTIITFNKDTIICEITLVNEENIFYKYKKRKKSIQSHIALHDVMSYRVDNKTVIINIDDVESSEAIGVKENKALTWLPLIIFGGVIIGILLLYLLVYFTLLRGN